MKTIYGIAFMRAYYTRSMGHCQEALAAGCWAKFMGIQNYLMEQID
jgi:hypothetical protein